MKKMGKGTGSKRQLRHTLLIVTYDTCYHSCPSCLSIFEHKIPQNEVARWVEDVGVVFNTCHFPIFIECGSCLEYPTPYNLMRMKKEKHKSITTS